VRNFNRITLSIVFVVLAAFGAMQSQTLNIYNINSSAFPRVSANYVAFDALGKPLTGLTAADFRVIETAQGGNPVNVTPTITQVCKETNKEPEASIIIVLDRSKSMDDLVKGKARFEYAKDAIRSFVSKINFVDSTKICLVTFSGSYEVKVPWTNNPQAIYDTLTKIKATTSTDYKLPFETPGSNIYELFLQRPANIPKFVFFLTDGYPNPGIGDESKFVAENTVKLRAQAIRFFSVTILEKAPHTTLEALAVATGGKSIVTTEDQLADLFGLLALEVSVRQECSITWTSPYSCSDQARNRVAAITLLKGPNPTVNASFVTPLSSIAKTLLSDQVLFCGDPLANQSQLTVVTLTAQNAPFYATAGIVNPSTYFRVEDWDYPNAQATFVPFTIAAGNSRKIQVRFTQGPVQTFRQAQIELAGSPCPPIISLVGGQGLVTLKYPNGGELLSTCDTVTIKWAGVLPTQPVSLQYSDDGGLTWITISAAATGLSYQWQAPRPGTKYKVRVSVTPIGQYQWLKGLGDVGSETATALDISASGLRVYISGYFNGPTKLGTVTSTNLVGNVDGFLAELDSDGNFVKAALLTGNASNDERVTGVVTDNQGNYYVAGYFTSQNAQFGSQPLSKQNIDISNMFVYKFDQNGGLQWVNYGTGDALSACTANSTTIAIRYVGGIPQILVGGKFTRFVRVGQSSTGTYVQSNKYNDNTSRNYYAIYDVNGFAQFYAGTMPPGWSPQAMTRTDATGFVYETGTYASANKTVAPPTISIQNMGATDVYVSKFGSVPSSADTSDIFSAKSPQLAFSIPTAVMTAIAQGQNSSNSFTGVLCNTGDFPLIIKGHTITGANIGDFVVVSKIDSVRLDKGECISLEFVFAPTGTGPRTATLLVEGNCGSTSTLQLEGNGLPPCTYDVTANVVFGKVPLGQTPSQGPLCILKNTGPTNLSGIVSATGSTEITIAPLGAFTLKPNECLNLTVTINPVDAGIKSAIIDYGLQAECGVPTTTVNAEVVEPKVAITNVDFGRRRLRTVAMDTIVMTNLNTEPAIVTGISVSDATNANLKFELPGTPINLAPSATIRIPVSFDPFTRGQHSVLVNAKVQGQTQPVVGEARGFGYLPVISATGYTFGAWTVGLTSPEKGNVTIKNTDTDADLNISSIAFTTPSADFAWEYPLPPTPIKIGPNSELKLSVLFTPQTAGNRTVNVNICHDAKIGPAPLPPCVDTVVIVQGVGAEPSDIPPVVFGNVLTCASKTIDVPIINPNPSIALNCDTPVPTGDVTAFTISEAGPFVVPPGGSRVVRITFSPPAIATYNVSYGIANDQGLKLNITASGTGISTPASFEFGNIVEGIVGQPVVVPVMVTTGNLATVVIPEVVLTFTFSEKYLAFSKFTTPEAPGWKFVPDVTIPGKLIVTATPIAGTELTSGIFVSPVFDVFLTADSSINVSVDATVPIPCIVTSGDVGQVKVKQVCFSAGRIVQIGGNQFAMSSPTPNPSNTSATVQYSTGITVSTSFELVDKMGNLVYSFSTTVNPSGTYELQLDASTLSSGLYYLRMVSGPYMAVQLLSVVK